MTKKKLARVIATWLITGIMTSVFVLDIISLAIGNKYVNEVEFKEENFTLEDGDDRIHFLNTGNSDCMIIESNGKFALIDSGEGDNNPRKKQEYSGNRQNVIDYINNVCADENGNVNFEFALATHIHYDHVGNFKEIFGEQNIYAEKFYMKKFDGKTASELEYSDWGNKETYEGILETLKARQIPVFSDLPDNEFQLGDFTVKFINTVTPDSLAGVGENASSVGVIIEKCGKRAFLGADYTRTCGLEEIYQDEIGKIDLLKMGHHGYYGSSSRNFMKILDPEIAICTNYIGKIYPNVKWNITMVAKAPIFSTVHRNGIVATFTDRGEIILSGNAMENAKTNK